MPSLHRTPVILISVDGLRPDFYLEPRYPAPRLRELMSRGAWAEGAVPDYPTLTFTNHATIATGAPSREHGIVANTAFAPEKSPKEDWVSDESAFRIDPIWRVAERHGVRCALLRWPTTVGAPVTWLVPEAFTTEGEEAEARGASWSETLAKTDPAFARELLRSTGDRVLTSRAQFDEWTARAAVYLLDAYSPGLLMLHLIGLDDAQHRSGRDSPEIIESVAATDRLVGSILDRVALDRATAIVTGDHGFIDLRRRINLHVIFARKGWIRVIDGRIAEWSAVAHIGCAQAAVYCRRDPQGVLGALERESRGLFNVVRREELDRLGAYPGALCAVDALPGYGFSDDFEGPSVFDLPSARGDHGFHPRHPEMNAGLLLAGPGVEVGLRLGTPSLRDIAPTLASMLGIPAPYSGAGAGKALSLIRTEAAPSPSFPTRAASAILPRHRQ